MPPAQSALSPTLSNPAIGQIRRELDTVDSTQDEARRWADDPKNPAPHGAVVVAQHQTRGRGRRGRNWDTTGGTLVFSVLLGGEFVAQRASALTLLPLAAGVAVQAGCAASGAVGALKWPNDLLTPDRRKLAGILLEADLRGEKVRRAVLGIGINVTAAPPGAACLNDGLSKQRPPLTRHEVLENVLAALEHWLAQPAGAVLEAWRAHNLTLGHPVEITTPAGLLAGIAHDIDAQGNLLVRQIEGQIVTIHAGDVQLVGQLGGESG